ncbi:uncharacterized protein LACBIDRAFT_297605 [Laccaria bicolor S238N-H82]|uniref:Predicted protein n=1 Tax=Laccaria bicolor (strain S238N-H82 / ATCC MYA-4686) TaxID=486041 RepID=B0DBK8_LACBS|nr:uncharacterized protein LACBIDRAFT_297605 [Laccaria bicolor S238N-H82]EDR08201.1 predicted protein [Laccaria bicolor S238N-H82]|eukprot:XP_001881271.1 predicted protein [Laccaria bicolor S238N-H82]
MNTSLSNNNLSDRQVMLGTHKPSMYTQRRFLAYGKLLFVAKYDPISNTYETPTYEYQHRATTHLHVSIIKWPRILQATYIIQKTYISLPRRTSHPRAAAPSAYLDCRLDLNTIAVHTRNAEYNPKHFAAVILRICEPKTNALVFVSDKMVGIGAKSEDDSRLASLEYACAMAWFGRKFIQVQATEHHPEVTSS